MITTTYSNPIVTRFGSYPRRAWTGGDVPPQGEYLRNPAYAAIVQYYFREQVADCLGLDYWACAGTSALQRARIFWNRAKLDGWRSYRP
jgi:hypothetical protein